MDDGPYWVILLMYGSHDMRHTSFRRLTLVNETPGFWGVTEVTTINDVATTNPSCCKTKWLILKRKRSRLIMSNQDKFMSRHQLEVAT